MASKPRTKAAAPTRSLSQFVRDKRRAGCPVCALAPEIQAELRTAREKRIPQATVLEWLRNEVGAKVTTPDLTTHRNARHDSDDE